MASNALGLILFLASEKRGFEMSRWGPSVDCENCGQTVEYGSLIDGLCEDCNPVGDFHWLEEMQADEDRREREI